MKPLPAIAALVLLALAAGTAAAQPLRRFAVIAGNDEGGDGTRPLLFARDDARKVHDILTRLGGVRFEDASLLLNADAEALLTALGELERRARDATRRGERTLLILYYSGHAKDGALRLDDSTIPFESLKHRLEQAPADVRIAVFDSCRSGTLTRTKGVRRAPAFEVESDATRKARGLVILTSSAADEDSQESDQLGGSYFSHHLASGLLGAADRSGDGRVTLGEAYAYAYERTVAATADSAAGAQHPTFSYDLAGNGDVVLTDVAHRREGLLFPAHTPGGTYFVVDQRGFVAAEVQKLDGAERRIALAPGTYRVNRRLADRLRVGQVTIDDGQTVVLDERRLEDAPFSDDPVKGPGLSRLYARRFGFGMGLAYQSFLDDTTRGGYFGSTPLVAVDLQLHNLFRRNLSLGLDLAMGSARGTLVTDTFRAGYQFAELNVGTTLLYEWAEGRLVPQAGARLAVVVMSRAVEGIPFGTQFYYALTPGLVLGMRYRVSRGWSVGARARLHYVPYNIDENRSLGFFELGTTLGYEL